MTAMFMFLAMAGAAGFAYTLFDDTRHGRILRASELLMYLSSLYLLLTMI